MARQRRPRLSWFRFYVDDFLGGTSALTGADTGHYLLLLLAQWNSKSKQLVPSDPKRLKTLCRGEEPSEAVLEKFVAVDGGLRNLRISREWELTNREFTGKSKGGGDHSKPESVADTAPDTAPDTVAESVQKTVRNPEPEPNKEKNIYSRAKLDQIFEYWKQRTGHTEAVFTPKRKKKVCDRLKQGYTVEQILLAIDGNLASKFHQGENDQQKVYDDLALICRDGEHVENFIRDAQGGGEPEFDTRPLPSWEEAENA